MNQPSPMLGGFLLHSVVKVEFPLTRCEIAWIGRKKTATTSGADYLGRPFSGGVRGGSRDGTFQGNERYAKFAIVNQTPLQRTLVT